MRSLTDSWTLGGIRVPNRVLLAPLAGIGNWFVRLQAKRYGAGLAFSEMVSSFAIHYRNERTCREMLTIHPDERAGGPVAMQLFGHDPEIMRSAAGQVADAGTAAGSLTVRVLSGGTELRRVTGEGAFDFRKGQFREAAESRSGSATGRAELIYAPPILYQRGIVVSVGPRSSSPTTWRATASGSITRRRNAAGR